MAITIEVPKKFATRLQQIVLDLEAEFEAEKAQQQAEAESEEATEEAEVAQEDDVAASEEAEVLAELLEDMPMADAGYSEELTPSTEVILIEEATEVKQGQEDCNEYIETHVEVSELEEAGAEMEQEQEVLKQIMAERDDAFSPPVVNTPVSPVAMHQAPLSFGELGGRKGRRLHIINCQARTDGRIVCTFYQQASIQPRRFSQPFQIRASGRFGLRRGFNKISPASVGSDVYLSDIEGLVYSSLD